MYRASFSRSALSFVLCFALLAVSFVRPPVARAEPLTISAAVVTAIVAAGASYVAYDSLESACQSNDLTLAEGRAAMAIGQAVFGVSSLSQQQTLMQVMGDYKLAPAVANGFKKAGSSAASMFQSVVDSARFVAGEWWFNLSGVNSISVVTSDYGSVAIPAYIGGVGTSGVYWSNYSDATKNWINTSLSGTPNDVSVSAVLATLGFTWPNIAANKIKAMTNYSPSITGSYPNRILTVPSVNVWCTQHNASHSSPIFSYTEATGVLAISGATAWLTNHAPAVTGLLSSATLTVPQAAPFTNTSSAETTPKKVPFPPISWGIDKPATNDSNVVDDALSGEGIGIDPVTGAFSIGSAIASLYGSIVNIPTTIVNAITSLFDLLTDGFTKTITAMSDLPANIGQAIDGFLSPTLDGIQTGIGDVINGVSALGTEVGQSIDGFIGGTLDNINSGIDNVIVGIGSIGATVGQSIDGFIGGTLDNIFTGIGEVYNGITALGTQVGQSIDGFIGGALDSAVAGIGALSVTLAAIWAWLSDVAAVSIAAISAGIASLTTVLTQILAWTGTLAGSIADVLVDTFNPSIVADPILDFIDLFDDLFFIFRGWS